MKKTTTVLICRVPNDLADKIRERADQKQMSLNEYFRWLLLRFVR